MVPPPVCKTGVRRCAVVGLALSRLVSHDCFLHYKRVRMFMWPAFAKMSALYIVVACAYVKRAGARRSGPIAGPWRDGPPPPFLILGSTAPIEANSPRLGLRLYVLAVLG